MTRPFVFRIHAAEIFSEIHALTVEEKGAFLSQFVTDLLTLTGSTTYSKKVIEETMQFIEVKRKNGLKGGRPKKLNKPKVKLNKPKANPEEEEVKNKTKEKPPLPDWISESDWKDFLSHRQLLKKPLSDLAAVRMLRKLDELRGKNYDPARLLNKAIQKGWLDVYVDDDCKHPQPERPIF